jgi:hypothetical protein
VISLITITRVISLITITRVISLITITRVISLITINRVISLITITRVISSITITRVISLITITRVISSISSRSSSRHRTAVALLGDLLEDLVEQSSLDGLVRRGVLLVLLAGNTDTRYASRLQRPRPL